MRVKNSKETNNNVLTDTYEHIVELFTNYQSVDYKAALVDNEVGSEQDYNLSVSTYVEQEDT